MFASWLIWLIGCVMLAAAGFATAALPRLRARAYTRRAAWASARSAIDTATVSRDAAADRVVEAEQLLARAQALAAAGGGRAAARTATGYARQADQLWRAVSGG